MPANKRTPSTQRELRSGREDRTLTRADDTRRDDDKLRELGIGLRDIDYTIKWYFDNVIKPHVDEFGQQVQVPVMYGSPERWKSMQADGYFRDKEGKIMTPLIAYKRTSITKNKSLISKIDGNYPQIQYNQQVGYTQHNKYDQFSVLNNVRPTKMFINTVIPDYVDLVYDVVLWTDDIHSMNLITEAILYAEGSFWGEPERFKFRSKIDSFSSTNEVIADADRSVRTTFQLTLAGYIITDALIKHLSKKHGSKVYEATQIATDFTPEINPQIKPVIDSFEVGPKTS